MNRVVRDFRGTKNKVANGVKNADDSSSKGKRGDVFRYFRRTYVFKTTFLSIRRE